MDKCRLIDNKIIRLIFLGLIFCSSMFGVLMQVGVFKGNISFNTFNFFTIQSNIICVLYALLNFISILRNKEFKISRLLNGGSVLYILITMVVAHFVLSLGFTMNGEFDYSMLFVHYITPILVILYYLIFQNHPFIKKTDPLKWLYYPLVYFIYVMIVGNTIGGIGAGESLYPYPFLDFQNLGFWKFALNIFGMMIGFVGSGYLLFLIDILLSKLFRYL